MTNEWNLHIRPDTNKPIDDIQTFYNDGTFRDSLSHGGTWIQDGDVISLRYNESPLYPLAGIIRGYSMGGTTMSGTGFNEHTSWSATKRLGNTAPMA